MATVLAAAAGAAAGAALGLWWPGRAVARRPGPPARLSRLAGRLGVPVPGDLPDLLEAAGLPAARAGDVAAGQAVLAVAGAAAGLWCSSAAPGRMGPLLVVAGPAAGYLLPVAVLRRGAARRRAAVAGTLADTLDLLAVASRAGLSPVRAMAEVGARAPGVLGEELRGTARRTALGEPWGTALDRLRRRCPHPGVAAMVAALRRAERHGAPAAPALLALAADARAEHARALRDHAARAAPRIQLVVALLLVPGVLLTLAAVLVPRVL